MWAGSFWTRLVAAAGWQVRKDPPYRAVAGEPIVTAFGAREARRLNAMIDARSASAALP